MTFFTGLLPAVPGLVIRYRDPRSQRFIRPASRAHRTMRHALLAIAATPDLEQRGGAVPCRQRHQLHVAQQIHAL
jgi:hypothetical protein